MGLRWEAPLVPPSIRKFTEVPVEAERYAGKKILSIHGASDELVPVRRGQEDLMAIQEVAKEGMELWIVDGVGHAVTADMVKRTGEWVWRWALSEESAGFTPARPKY
jgi:predicted esterase